MTMNRPETFARIPAMSRILSALLLCLLGFPGNPLAQSPSPRHEFRGVWIASVDNIDWPSRKGLPVDSQKAEFTRLMDLYQSLGMNAVVMQIRPAADAFYPSPYEPWSEWLTGTQGKPPSPYYDPLEFMIAEAHRRGIEFHAWLNPYRAVFNTRTSSISRTHVSRLHPEWFLEYGGKRYFDPGHPEAQSFVTKVVSDIVNRYAVDAIHFDDYFYPYRISGKEFPDTSTYRRFNGGLPIDAWRRSNVDSIILGLNRAIKAARPDCRFGISPFGVWRNRDRDERGSDTKAGQTNYDDLYADILLWLREGWIDYVAPQLYWEFGHPNAPYEVLLDWWSKNSHGKPCYIGLGYYKAGGKGIWSDRTLLPRQLSAIRSTPNIDGAIYFSGKTFLKNPLGWNDSLRNNYYRLPSLVPAAAGASPSNTPVPILTNVRVQEANRVAFTANAPKGFDGRIRKVAVYVNENPSAGFEGARLVAVSPYSRSVPFTIDCPDDAGSVRFHVTYVDAENREGRADGDGAATIRFEKSAQGRWEIR
jgi:uncharacterized lipoprotein YddW (UPF0748 family)